MAIMTSFNVINVKYVKDERQYEKWFNHSKYLLDDCFTPPGRENKKRKTMTKTSQMNMDYIQPKKNPKANNYIYKQSLISNS